MWFWVRLQKAGGRCSVCLMNSQAMSRPPQLPPRCPSQNFTSPTMQKDDSFLSPDTFFSEKPSWFDDRLIEPERSPHGISVQRSSSDSAAILDVLSTFQCPTPPAEEVDLSENTGATEMGCGLETSCVYGPNSPRERSRLTTSESSIVTAVLENVPCNPLQYLVVDALTGSDVCEPSWIGDANNASGCPDDAEKVQKRHSGQRSRVRKLQHIAELERTVDTLQNLAAKLATRVASLFQLRAALSIENKNLRRQIANVQQEKLYKEGQLQLLKDEAERLKPLPKGHRRSRSVASCFEKSPFQANTLGISWEMLDMGKLSLNGSPVHASRGFGR